MFTVAQRLYTAKFGTELMKKIRKSDLTEVLSAKNGSFKKLITILPVYLTKLSRITLRDTMKPTSTNY